MVYESAYVRSRRAFLSLSCHGALAALLAHKCDAQSQESLPVTGYGHPKLKAVDDFMTEFVKRFQVPGAALAITHQGQLVYARGIGFANRDLKTPVQPDSLFRIASVSKPITAVAILQWIEQGRLKFDDRVFDLMQLTPPDSNQLDVRWRKVTVRQCLEHTGGWDREQSFDPIGIPWDIAKSLGIKTPVAPTDVVRYMLSQPLDFEPGERFAYSNLGYLVLGRVIEVLSRTTYEAHVKTRVLEPLGITSMRLGRALVQHREPREVQYYDSENRTAAALYPPKYGETVPLPDGAQNFEGFAAHGGWIGSAVDLIKFATAFDQPNNCKLLQSETIAQMWSRPTEIAGADSNGKLKRAYYGCGWMIRHPNESDRTNQWHAGYISGSEALLVRRWDGFNWVALFNTNNAPRSLVTEIDPEIHKVVNGIGSWPMVDHFEEFSPRR